MARDKRSHNGTARHWPRCPNDAIRNAYPYAWASRFKTERIGFSGQTGARATITLPPTTTQPGKGKTRILVLEAIDGSMWRTVTAGK